jgi:hypothetical protein
MSHYGTIEEVVAGEVVTVWFGVNQVPDRTVLGDFMAPLYGIGWHLGRVNHYHPFTGNYEARIAPSKLSLGIDIIGNLFHYRLLSSSTELIGVTSAVASATFLLMIYNNCPGRSREKLDELLTKPAFSGITIWLYIFRK